MPIMAIKRDVLVCVYMCVRVTASQRARDRKADIEPRPPLP